MESYLLECGIIFIGMWHHIYWNMALHKLEYVVISIGISDGTIPKFTSIPIDADSYKCSISIPILDSSYNISCGG